MEMKMYEKMQLLPLFLGMSLDDFSEIMKTLKLDFDQYNDGDTIIQQGDPFEHLIYILDGDYDIEFHCGYPSMIVTEHCTDAPYMIEPYNLFSVKRNSERTYSFRSRGATFRIGKHVLTHKLMTHPIIKSNMINHTSNLVRKMSDNFTDVATMTIENKIVGLIRRICKVRHGSKDVRIKMEVLAECIQEPRLNVSRVLNRWNDEKKIVLRRNGFEISELNALGK